MSIDGEGVEKLRRQRGLSREELARQAGVAASTVEKVEKGGASARLKTARGIAAALGVEIQELDRKRLAQSKS